MCKFRAKADSDGQRLRNDFTDIHRMRVEMGIKLLSIQPRKPNQNASIERFNRSFRDEFIEANLFNSIEEAQEAAYVWGTDYNEFRPHEFLGDKTPMEFRPTIFNSGISSFVLST